MIVTKEQARCLRKFGFDRETYRKYRFSPMQGEVVWSTSCELYNHNKDEGFYSAPTVSEALNFMREEKGIECSIQLYHDLSRTKALYKWAYLRENEIGSYHKYDVIEPEVQFNTHPEANLALLDAVIKYIEENEKAM